MMKYFENICTRMYSLNLVIAWVKAEENHGLKNTIFISKNKVVIQLIDLEEAEKFHSELKEKINEDYFDSVVEAYFEAIEKKDLVKIFECLAIFDEIDNYPWIVTSDILRRLMKVRSTTESLIYELQREGPKDYVLFKNQIYYIK